MITLVAVTGTVLVGFAVGQFHEAPPVYDPGGLTCMVDDFAVADPGLWATVGVDLLAAVTRAAPDRGAAQVVVVTAARDDLKRAALDQSGLTPHRGGGSPRPPAPAVGAVAGSGPNVRS